MNDKIKYDYGKPRLALVPPESIRAIGEVMTYGVTKYYEGSWREVEPWRYRDAMMRHLVSYLEDPCGVDKESGLPHLWHLTTNAAFLCELEANNIAIKSSPLMKDNKKEEIKMRRYGLGNFVFDIFMSAISGGLWLIWIFVREMRGRRD